jgi:IS1 family transposase
VFHVCVILIANRFLHITFRFPAANVEKEKKRKRESLLSRLSVKRVSFEINNNICCFTKIYRGHNIETTRRPTSGIEVEDCFHSLSTRSYVHYESRGVYQ